MSPNEGAITTCCNKYENQKKNQKNGELKKKIYIKCTIFHFGQKNDKDIQKRSITK